MAKRDSILVALLCILVISLGMNLYWGYSLISNEQKVSLNSHDSESITNTPEGVKANESESSGFVFDYDKIGYEDDTPVENSVYMLKYKGYDAIYLYKQKVENSNPEEGYISYNDVRLPVQFSELDSPRRIFTFNGPRINFISQYFLDKEDGFYSVVLQYYENDRDVNPFFATYRVNLSDLDYKRVKAFDTSKITYGDKYNSGNIFDIQEGKFYIYKLNSWSLGDAIDEVDDAYLVVNADTGEETYLGKVVSPIIDTGSGMLTYEEGGEIKSVKLP
ncbi:hypothetical protein H6764_03240 [Candidatus Nomurabacteria bacterium]|nr:hypothetical protein [Candidatus Nomurabacteria bacterium]